jgi:hypothetical protein
MIKAPKKVKTRSIAQNASGGECRGQFPDLSFVVKDYFVRLLRYAKTAIFLALCVTKTPGKCFGAWYYFF